MPQPNRNPAADDVGELPMQVKRGSIQKAYRALLSYMMDLQRHFTRKYGASAVSCLYQVTWT